LTDSQAIRQARYIFNVGKMLRHHVFSSLAHMEAAGRTGIRCGDLSLAQLNLIFAVRGQGEVTLTGLAEILGVSPPSVSVMVDRLVERGQLIRERSTSDRRKLVIQVSPDEDQHVAAIEEQMIAAFVELVEEVGPETAKKWSEVLERVEQVLKERQHVERTGKK